jgi:hypothetical protein
MKQDADTASPGLTAKQVDSIAQNKTCDYVQMLQHKIRLEGRQKSERLKKG